MDVNYPLATIPATSSYVLEVIRDMHRQQCQFDSVTDPGATLSYETTVYEWREACDLVAWRELGHAHNTIWNIQVSDAQWRAVLEPANKRRLLEVCELIAKHARQPVIRPMTLLGRTCLPAGAFLTIRSLLRRVGARVEGLCPSTPLADYARQHYEVFLGPISQLAPGELPLVRIRTPIYNLAEWGVIVSALLLFIGWLIAVFLGSATISIVGALLLLGFYLLTWIASPMLPTAVEFGDLRTFRDLAIVISGFAARKQPSVGQDNFPR